jgi:hypothetical protein
MQKGFYFAKIHIDNYTITKKLIINWSVVSLLPTKIYLLFTIVVASFRPSIFIYRPQNESAERYLLYLM